MLANKLAPAKLYTVFTPCFPSEVSWRRNWCKNEHPIHDSLMTTGAAQMYILGLMKCTLSLAQMSFLDESSIMEMLMIKPQYEAPLCWVSEKGVGVLNKTLHVQTKALKGCSFSSNRSESYNLLILRRSNDVVNNIIHFRLQAQRRTG